MQIECRQFALGEDCVSTLGIYLTEKTLIYLHMTRWIKLYRKSTKCKVFSIRDLKHDI